MKTGWLIYEKQDAIDNKAYIDWFISEAHQQQIRLTLILRENITYGLKDGKRFVQTTEDDALPDFMIIRTIEPLLTVHVEKMGVHTFNPSTVATIANDKALTHQHILDLAIPMVHTLFFKKHLLPTTPPLRFPFIVKATGGRGGQEVYWIDSTATWHALRQRDLATDLVIQETNVQVGKDIRVFIVGKKVIGAVLRESKTDYRANFKLGGQAIWYDLSESEYETVMKIVHAFDFGMVGIDFLIGQDGHLYFNEIEDIVGSRTLSHVSDLNILKEYVTYIKDHI